MTKAPTPEIVQTYHRCLLMHHKAEVEVNHYMRQWNVGQLHPDDYPAAQLAIVQLRDAAVARYDAEYALFREMARLAGPSAPETAQPDQ